MKIYRMRGYILRKGLEENGWEALKDNLMFKLPDEVDPWQAIDRDFKRIASYWLITLDELKEEEE